jgi:predicted metal-binding membrane protein
LCLSKCHNPLSFIMTSWCDGVKGAVIDGWDAAGSCAPKCSHST